MRNSLLGNAFFRNATRQPRDNFMGFSRAVSAVSPSTIALSLNESFYALGCDSFFKKVASLEFKQFLMRAWLAGIILAIFGLWLATI